MAKWIEITIDVIIHATEDDKKIFHALEDILGLDEDDFDVRRTTGYYDNPITILNARVAKNRAENLMKKVIELLSEEQIRCLASEVEARTVGSMFHMRLGKQEMIGGHLVLTEKDSIRMRISAPTYSKRDASDVFAGILQMAN